MLTFSRFPLRQLLFGVTLVLVALLDPLGLASTTDDASSRWLNRLLATWYPAEGQRQVVVVLIDDDYLKHNDTYWPLPYSDQSKLFKRLLAYKPGAVFIDMLYSHDHSREVPGQPQRMESQVLANVFERYRQQGIALILANTGAKDSTQGTVNALPRLAQASTPGVVNWSGYGNQYPLAVTTEMGPLDTPAMALYRQYCRQQACPQLPADAQSAARLPAMTVQWGVHRSPLQAQVSDMGDCTVPGLFDQLLQALFWKLGNNAQSNCAYSLTLSAQDLEVTDPEDQLLIRQLLQGKQVFVGARIAGTGDVTLSPLHGKIPGVYLHAMALDNLISHGMDYYRTTPSLADLGMPARWTVDVLDVVELCLLGIIAYLKGALDAPLLAPSTGGRQVRVRLRPLTAWAVVLALLAGLSTLLCFNHFTPANVLGLLLLSLTLFSQKLQALFENMKHRRLDFSPQGPL